MRSWILAAVLAVAPGGYAAAQQSGVTITGWGSGAPTKPAATQAPAPGGWTPPPVLADGESPYGKVVKPHQRATEKPERWMRLAGEPFVTQGEVREREALLTFPVAPLYTGHLAAQPDRFAGVLSGVPLIPAGSPVYALPLNDKLSWCAPRKVALKSGGARWDADCFVPHPLYSSLYRHGSATGQGLFVVEAVAAGGAIQAPRIREEPVDFGEYPRLAYRFNGWTKENAILQLDAGVQRRPRALDYIFLKREADGSVVLKALDGELRLTPSGDKLKSARIEVIRPPTAKAQSPF